MQGKLSDGRRHPWFSSLLSLVILTGAGLSAAIAQDSRTAAAAPQAKAAGGGQYYFEFRARYAWDYGHTYVIHGRVGEPITKASVAGLSPIGGDDPTYWVIGHYVPVPAETGWTDGDTEDKYVSARYRVYVSKAEYDRVMAYIRHLQATSHTWSVELYNCNAFVADIARFMGLRTPASTLIYPKVFINNLRQINTHPEMADNLVEQNVKEMSSPTRDGRAMINNGVYASGRAMTGNAVSQATRPAGPTVTIGPVRVSNSATESVAASSSAQ